MCAPLSPPVPATPRPATARREWLAPVGVGLAALGGCAVVGLSAPGATPLPPCPFRALTGWDCPGCGLTRGARQLARLNIGNALDYNLLLVAFVPVVGYLYLAWLAGTFGFKLPRPALGRRGGAVLVALLVVFTVVRNIPLGPGRYLNSGR